MLLGYPALIATLLTWFVQDTATYAATALGAVRDAFDGRLGPDSLSNDFLRIEGRTCSRIRRYRHLRTEHAGTTH